MDTSEQLGKSTYRLDMIARNLIYVVAFLLPLAVLPISWMPLAMTKMAILAFGTLGALILWSIARLKEHRTSFPESHVLWTALLLILGYFISALLASHLLTALVGFGYETDTVFATFVFVASLAAVALTVRKVSHFINLQKVVLASFLLVGVFQILRIVIGGGTVFPNIFSADATTSLLGSWNDLAVFGGLAILTALSGLALFSAQKIRWVLYSVITIALFLLIVVNMFVVWSVLTLFIFALSVYISGDASYERETGKFKAVFPWKRLIPSMVVLLVSITFIVAGSTIGPKINTVLKISFVDVRPSWEGTIAVGSGVYANNFLLGSGPNSFSREWTKYKPAGSNQSNFWNANFNSGIGFIPTAFVTGGIVVGLLWLLFFAAFIRLGYRTLSKRIVQPGLMYITISSYIGAVFLWVITILYVPQIVMLAYAFMLTGLAIAASRIVGIVRTRETSAERGYAEGLAHTGIMAALLVVAMGVFVIAVNRVVISTMLSHVVTVANSGKLDTASKEAATLERIGGGIRSQRLQMNIGMGQLAAVLKEKKSKDVKAQQKRFQDTLSKTIRSAQAVVAADKTDYQSWLSLGDIYAQLVPLKIKGAYERSVLAYVKAGEQNKNTPIVPIRLAQLALQKKDLKSARTYANAALVLKSNYTDAYYLLSQISIQDKDTKAAIKATEAAAVLRPDNVGLLFQLGILQYSEKAYTKVVPVLERAVTINPKYSNALYFLGLAYDKTKNPKGALAAFKRVAKLNPKNKDVTAIIVALESGKSAESALKSNAGASPVTGTLPVTTKK